MRILRALKTIVRIAGWSFIGLGLVILVGACARTETQPGDARNIPHTVEVPEVNLARALKDSELVCEKEPCHEGVGFLISKVSSESNAKTVKLQQCTVFLIHKTLMVTNAHCLPPEIQKRNSSCGDLVHIKLARRSGETKNVEVKCESIVFASPIVSDPKNPDFVRIPDYALIRVSGEHGHKHFDVSREGLGDGVDVQAFVVDPAHENVENGTQLRGIIRRKTCRSIVGTSVVPGAVQSHYAVSTIAGCDVIHGNSGSPIIDSLGKVRGVLSATVPSQAASSAPKSVVTPEKYETVNLVANAACMKLPWFVSAQPIPQPEACGKHLTNDDLLARAVAKPTGSFGSVFQSWKSAAPKAFGFELFNNVEAAEKISAQVPIKSGKISIPMTYPAMKCIQPPAGWASASEALPQGLLSYKREGDKVEMSFEIPVWSLRTKHDQYYRVGLIPSEEGKAVVRAMIHDVSTLNESREGLVDFTIESNHALLKARAVNQKLPLCVE